MFVLFLQDWEPRAEVLLDPALGDGEEGAGPGCDGRWSDVALTWRGDGKFLATSHRVGDPSAG